MLPKITVLKQHACTVDADVIDSRQSPYKGPSQEGPRFRSMSETKEATGSV